MSDISFRLLQILADGQYHSEAELARCMEITPTEIFKYFSSLGEQLASEAVFDPDKGYCLIGGLDLLIKENIQKWLDPGITDFIGEWTIHQSIDSTNSWLMARARADAPRGALCLAERQTAGRGRLGRYWVSPFGRNIYCSLLWRYAFPPSELGGLSLACGVAVARALTNLGVPDIKIKWPNDLLWDTRKLGGLLLEVGGESHGPCFVVVGIGINVKIPIGASSFIDQPWIDLDSIPSASALDRNQIIAAILNELVQALVLYGSRRLHAFLDDWHRYDFFSYGEKLSLTLGSEIHTGAYLGITREGALNIRVEGKCVSYTVGEVNRCRTGA